MSVSTVCQLCEQREADRTCGRCGRVVCDRHFDDGAGLCSECAGTGDPGPGRDPTPNPDGPNDDDVLSY